MPGICFSRFGFYLSNLRFVLPRFYTCGAGRQASLNRVWFNVSLTGEFYERKLFGNRLFGL
ncbi:hypothetical protein C1G86_0538 [Dehalococcoides mccartyi]|uniref:Uncharacterized protein n=1 Tax=Dehalococcoides mccartyi TaxID=61435 RepID=A0A328EQL7_9CHLR|nr:hypothetical protein C1G86_0538 [Dehalococcoides mccartyi]